MIKNPPPWPDGARCAVVFSFDVDADSVVHATHAERALDMPNALAHMRYDPLVAVPRLLDLFGGYGVPVTWFVPGWVIEAYPDQIAALPGSGGEVAHHGYFHQWPSAQSRDEERRTLERGCRAIERLNGHRPVGYRAPYYGLSRDTFDLLAEAGFAYDSSLFADDVPIILETQRGSLVELPIPASVDDYNQYVSGRAFDYLMKISAPQRALEVFQAEFDALWEFGGLWVSVWHPAVSGRPAQALAIRDLIEHMREKGGVWFATGQEVAAWVTRSRTEGRWAPRVERVPFYRTPVVRAPRTAASERRSAAQARSGRRSRPSVRRSRPR
jgi:peptidoglycan/xylan/chitin deacetylase (PgdA/CDA1 family)